jgi:RNA polymerase sigma factor (TIGR02999 family)
MLVPEFAVSRRAQTKRRMKNLPTAAVTQLLDSVAKGDAGAEAALFDLVSRDLRALANAHMRREGPGHTLQATALVNEAYLRLFGGAKVAPNSRKHFFGMASKVMRQVLVDHARKRDAGKRGGQRRQVTLDEGMAVGSAQYDVQLAVHEAIAALAEQDERQAQILDWHLFAGQSDKEIAETLGISERTVERDIRSGKLFVRRQLDRP